MKIKEYWEKSTPMTFDVENLSYEERREFRYELQDYMHRVIFDTQSWRGKKVLEVGCGGGIDLLEFARYGAEIYGIDITQNAILKTHETAMSKEIKIEVRQASALDIPFKDDYFDTVFSFGVLHHIPEVESALKEIKRVLKPDGEIIAMLYNKDSLLYAYSIIHFHKGEGLSDEELVSKYSERNEGCPYTKAYTRQDAMELFSKYFKNVRVSTHYNVVDTLEKRKVKLNESGVDQYGFGWHHIVKGIK